MFLNGAVVFASGIGRLVGIASVAVVLLASLARRHGRYLHENATEDTRGTGWTFCYG